jgi:hypothetical protein
MDLGVIKSKKFVNYREKMLMVSAILDEISTVVKPLIFDKNFSAKMVFRKIDPWM